MTDTLPIAGDEPDGVSDGLVRVFADPLFVVHDDARSVAIASMARELLARRAAEAGSGDLHSLARRAVDWMEDGPERPFTGKETDEEYRAHMALDLAAALASPPAQPAGAPTSAAPEGVSATREGAASPAPSSSAGVYSDSPGAASIARRCAERIVEWRTQMREEPSTDDLVSILAPLLAGRECAAADGITALLDMGPLYQVQCGTTDPDARPPLPRFFCAVFKATDGGRELRHVGRGDTLSDAIIAACAYRAALPADPGAGAAARGEGC